MTRQAALGLVVLIGIWTSAALSAPDNLADGFASPPDAAKPWAYWWWLDSYATREGITKDLEEMKRQGIAGVLLFDAGEGKGSPVGPVFMSPDWRELFKHAIREADRGLRSARICAAAGTLEEHGSQPSTPPSGWSGRRSNSKAPVR